MSRSANRSPKGPSSCSLPLPRQTPADRNIDCVQPVSVSALLVGLILAASLSGLLVSPGLIAPGLPGSAARTWKGWVCRAARLGGGFAALVWVAGPDGEGWRRTIALVRG